MPRAFPGNSSTSFRDAFAEALFRASLTQRRYRVWYDHVNKLWSFTELTAQVR